MTRQLMTRQLMTRQLMSSPTHYAQEVLHTFGFLDNFARVTRVTRVTPMKPNTHSSFVKK